MHLPKQFFYTKEHEWVSARTGVAKVGVTAYAVDQLGDIVHLDLPEVGKTFEEGDSFGTIESTKTVSDLYCPGKGKVTKVNKAVLDKPEVLQEDPYDKGWLIEISFDHTSSDLMNAEAYEKNIHEG